MVDRVKVEIGLRYESGREVKMVTEPREAMDALAYLSGYLNCEGGDVTLSSFRVAREYTGQGIFEVIGEDGTL